MPCDPDGQVSSDLVGPLGTQRFLVPTSTPESCFEKSGFYQNEAEKAGETIMHKNPQRSSNKAYARSCKELCHQIAARDVMDAAARSSKVTLIP